MTANVCFGVSVPMALAGIGFAHVISPPTQYLAIPFLTIVAASYISLAPHKSYSNYSRLYHIEYEIQTVDTAFFAANILFERNPTHSIHYPETEPAEPVEPNPKSPSGQTGGNSPSDPTVSTYSPTTSVASSLTTAGATLSTCPAYTPLPALPPSSSPSKSSVPRFVIQPTGFKFMENQNTDFERIVNRLFKAFGRVGLIVEEEQVAAMIHSRGLRDEVSPSLFEANGWRSVSLILCGSYWTWLEILQRRERMSLMRRIYTLAMSSK
jgi:hypothetical protein